MDLDSSRFLCRYGGIGRRAGFRFQCLYDVEVQVLLPTPWGISSVGRAPALQAGCQEFESPILHREYPEWSPSFLFSSAVERTTVNRLVPGSIPGRGV